MSLYPDSPYPLAQDIDALHRDELESFARAGTWGTARERTAIAAEARQARCAAGIQESVGDEALTTSARLPEVARELARRVALDGVTVDRAFCAEVLSQGVSEGAYVEIVGVVARLAHLDVFARGIRVPARALQDPDDSTSPSFERPAQARDEGFFVASLPSAPAWHWPSAWRP